MWKITIADADVELFSGEDLGANFTFKVADLKQPNTRSGNFADNISIPWSGINDAAIGYISHTLSKYEDGGLWVEKDIKIFRDNMLRFKGKGRLSLITKDRQPQRLEVTFLSGNLDWVRNIEGKTLQEMALPNFQLTKTNIESSWTSSYDTHHARFFPVNYGQWVNNTYVSIRDVRPHIPIRSMIEKIFQAQGYRIESDFFESSYGSRLTWLHVGDTWKLTETEETNLGFSSQRDPNPQALNSGTTTTIVFDDELSDPGSNYSVGTGIYTASNAGRMRFTCDLVIENTNMELMTADIEIIRDRGGNEGVLDTDSVSFSGNTAAVSLDTLFTNIQVGDQIFVRITDTTPGGFTSATVQSGATFLNETTDEIVETYTANLENYVPPNYTQKWFLQQIATLFKLEFFTDPIRRIVYIEPFSDFTNAKSSAVDWSTKVDRSKPINDRILDLDLKREQAFKYAEDDKDAVVKDQNVQTDTPLHGYIYRLGTRFQPGTDETEVGFAATAMKDETELDTSGTISMPQLWDELQTGVDYPAQSFDFLPRIVYYAGVVGSETWDWYDGTPEIGFPTAYPVDYNATAEALTSLAFNNFTNATGLFDRYHKAYYNTIEQGKFRECSVYLTDLDIARMDFRNLVKLKDEDGSHYWRLSEIREWNPDTTESTEVELVQDVFTSVSESAVFDAPFEEHSYRLAITTDSTQSANLTDFRHYVDLSDIGDATFWNNVDTDGEDLWVGDSNGTRLPAYVHSIDTVTNTGSYSYLQDESGSIDTVAYLYWGSATATQPGVGEPFGRNEVFAGFEAFWDMAQDPSGGAPQLTDLTGNGRNGTSQGSMTSGDLVDGQNGMKAWDYDSNDYVKFGDILDLFIRDVTTSIWVKWTATGLIGFIGKHQQAGTTGRYGLFQFNDGGTNVVAAQYDSTGSGALAKSASAFNDDSWHQLTQVIDRSANNNLYIDGVFIDSVAASTNSVSNSLEFAINNYYDVGGSFTNHAAIETSVASQRSAAASADLIATEYNNQDDPATFHTIGSVETP